MVRKSTGCSHRLEARHETRGASVYRRMSRLVPGATGESLDPYTMAAAALTVVSLALVVVAGLVVYTEGYGLAVFLYVAFWGILGALFGWFLVRGGAA